MVSCQQKKIGTTKHGASGSNNKSRGTGARGTQWRQSTDSPAVPPQTCARPMSCYRRVSWDTDEKTGNVGVSENSVPLNPMVLLIIIPIKWL